MNVEEALHEILILGVRNTAEVIERLQKRGYTDEEVLKVVYSALLAGKVDPKGTKDPFMGN